VSAVPHRHPEADVESLRGLVEAGASGAAAALAELVGRSVFHRMAVGSEGAAELAAGQRRIGVFFEVEGQLRGMVALLLAPAACDTIVRNLQGGGAGSDHGPQSSASALCEVGNIVASQTMSTVADTLGARILLSVPKLVSEDADAALARRVAERQRRGAVLRLESALVDCDEAFEALLVFVLDLRTA
jgi:chemotaxis protein CheY-P-specific phosphatase CheC